MRPYDLHFFPHPPLYLLAFFLLLGLAFVLLRYVLIGYVFERLGLSRRAAFAILLNLGNLQTLGAPVASIGGAGTFDGIFLTGIIAVLLAGAPARGHTPRQDGRGEPGEGP